MQLPTDFAPIIFDHKSLIIIFIVTLKKEISPKEEIRWAGTGANLIVHPMDIAAMHSAFRQDFDQIKAAMEGEADSAVLENINI